MIKSRYITVGPFFEEIPGQELQLLLTQRTGLAEALHKLSDELIAVNDAIEACITQARRQGTSDAASLGVLAAKRTRLAETIDELSDELVDVNRRVDALLDRAEQGPAALALGLVTANGSRARA